MRFPLLQWQRERFPLRNGIFFTLFHATALLVGRAAAEEPPTLEWRDVPGLAALWAFFLVLRVLDEHKDFAADAAAHPERVLQRGLVTLAQLRAVAAAAIVLQLSACLWLDGGVGPVTRWWAVALGWSLLMAREFFVPAWLRPRLVLYALSHMLVMPLVTLWVATMGDASAAGSPATWAFMGVAFLAGLAFEIARKIRAPGDEHPAADSYTQALGVPAASALLLGTVVAAAAATTALTVLVAGSLRPGLALPLAASVALAAATLHGFRRRPTARAARRSEAAVALATLGAHVVVIVALLAGRGTP